MDRSKNSGHLLALFTICIWGTTFVSTKVLLVNFQPVEILFFRFILGFFALCIVYPHILKIKSIKREALFVLAGLCGVTLYFLLENIALTYTLASNVGIIVCVSPFFTAILSRMFLKDEKLSSKFFIGFVLSIIGIIIVSISGGDKFEINPRGDILAVLAAFVWSIYSIVMRRISYFGYNTIQATRRVFLYGLILMIPALFIFDFNLGFERFNDMTSLLNILYLGIGASALCFVTWNMTVKRLGAIKASIYLNLSPIVTIAASAIVLGERVTIFTAIGCILALAGLFISQNNN